MLTFEFHLQHLLLIVDDVTIRVEGVAGAVNTDLQAQITSCRQTKPKNQWLGVKSENPGVSCQWMDIKDAVMVVVWVSPLLYSHSLTVSVTSKDTHSGVPLVSTFLAAM